MNSKFVKLGATKAIFVPNIAIDPGHGDEYDGIRQIDPGCVSANDYEKDFALTISNAVTLTLRGKGYRVAQTRTGDVSKAGKRLQWRIAKVPDSNMFISIHINANTERAANGFSVHYKSGDADSERLAKAIATAQSVMRNKGAVSARGLYLLNMYQGTAVLVEAGFISNASDLAMLKARSTVIGQQIAEGIEKYIKGIK